MPDPERRRERGNNPLHPPRINRSRLTIHKFCMPVFKIITHYRLKSLLPPPLPSTFFFFFFFFRRRPPLRRLPVSSSVTLLHPPCITCAPALSSGSAGASAAAADQSISIMSGHFTCFQPESKSVTSQRRTGELPRSSAAAGPEYLTDASKIVSFFCRVFFMHLFFFFSGQG